MPLFAIICTDKAGALTTRLATRPTHLDYLYSRCEVLTAGALLDAEGRPVGSLIVVETGDLTAAKTIAAEDPFAAAGVFESVSVRQWRLAIADSRPIK